MVEENNRKKISVIIPAKNESSTIQGLVEAIKQSPYVDEIIVVDDGSTDNTGKLAGLAGAKVITLPENRGKGYAMNKGVGSARNDLVLFIDADITGMSPEIVEKIVAPVLLNTYDMHAGLMERKSAIIKFFTRVGPVLSGQRVMRKEVWYSVPEYYKSRFEIEIALNYFAKRNGYQASSCVIEGWSQTIKERKYGLLKGFLSRVGMCLDITGVVVGLYVIERIRGWFASMLSIKDPKHSNRKRYRYIK
ncbi:MAG TPA: glycosyltransferase family 2 protein [Candidatus Paceibacterota bacterium]